MVPRLCGAKYVSGYRILLTFDDGKRGVIDLEHELSGEVFEPLRDVGLFRRFRFDAELDTVVWPTGAGVADADVGQQIVEGGSVGEPVSELLGLASQRLVGELLHIRLELVDLVHQRPQLFEDTLIP